MPMRVLGLLMPPERQMLHLTGDRGRRGESERRFQHSALAIRIAYIPIRPAERVLDRGHARHAHKPVIGRDHIQSHGRNPRRLDLPRNQSHGPATIRSNGGEESQVDLLADHVFCDRRSGLILKLARVGALEAHD